MILAGTVVGADSIVEHSKAPVLKTAMFYHAQNVNKIPLRNLRLPGLSEFLSSLFLLPLFPPFRLFFLNPGIQVNYLLAQGGIPFLASTNFLCRRGNGSLQFPESLFSFFHYPGQPLSEVRQHVRKCIRSVVSLTSQPRRCSRSRI